MMMTMMMMMMMMMQMVDAAVCTADHPSLSQDQACDTSDLPGTTSPPADSEMSAATDSDKGRLVAEIHDGFRARPQLPGTAASRDVSPPVAVIRRRTLSPPV